MENLEQFAGLPKALEKLSRRLCKDEAESRAFREAMCGGAEEEPAVVLPARLLSGNPVSSKANPGFLPAGVLRASECSDAPPDSYRLDLSSVFMAAPLLSIPPRASDMRLLDLCSSPGGKAILASRILRPGLIGCNEVIEKRIPALISNLKRCKISPVEVYSRDPGFFSARAPEAFDVVLVDAPCSGQSLYGTGEVPSGVFHQSLVQKNALRQRHILAESSKCVSAGGHLLYMTCTFSLEENEKIVEWFLKTNTAFTAVPVSVLKEFSSPFSNHPCYRLHPHQKLGRGGFTALLRHQRIGERNDSSELTPIWRQG